MMPDIDETDLAVLRLIHTGPVTMAYIQRMLRLPRPPLGSITRLRRAGYIQPPQAGTVGFYLTGEGRRKLLHNPVYA